MEKNRSELDNLFKKNISDFELSEKKGNWELLNHLLNEQDRKKKKRGLILFFLSLLLIVSTGLLILLPSKEKKVNTIITPRNSNTVASSSSTNNSPGNKNAFSGIGNQLKKNESDIISESNSQLFKNENSTLQHEEKNINKDLPTGAINPAIIPVNSTGTYHANSNTEIVFHQQPTISLHDSDKVIIKETEITKSSIADLPITKSGDSILINTVPDVTVSENLIVHDSLNPKTINDSLNEAAKNGGDRDSATLKENPELSRRFGINFYAGINFYSTGSATNSNHISPMGGLEFIHSFSSHVHAGLGILYSLQGGYQLADTISQEYYFLEKYSSQQTILIHKLHKLYFPLTLYYAIAPKHTLSATVQYSYLVNTIADFSETNIVSGIATDSNKNNVKGYMDGIESTTASLSLGYKFSLSRKFDWNIRLTHELSDLYVKEYFNGIDTKPSFSFQTFLIIKF